MRARRTDGWMRCDLHVHSIHSGMCTVPVARHFCRESYSDPVELYHCLKRRGMDLVTITDHDSVEAGAGLLRFPDFFLSEEATCRSPSGTEIHVGIYDINERQHTEIQRRRDDFFSLMAYLREQRLFFTANHVFSALTGERMLCDYEWFAREFPALEVRNGALPAAVNRAAEEFASALRKPVIAGSDAHACSSAGRAWTSVPGARTKSGFFAALRAGHGIPEGDSGTWWNLTRTVWNICGHMVAERPWTAVLAPLIASVPVATALIWAGEIRFARRWQDEARRILTVEPNIHEERGAA